MPTHGQRERARHAQILGQLAVGAGAESPFHRLSWFALERSASGLALVRAGDVLLANSRWHALARTPRKASGWTLCGDGEPRAYADLPQLAQQEIVRGAKLTRWTLRCERARPEQTLRLSIERVPSPANDGLVLLRCDDVTEERRREQALLELRDRYAQRERIASLGLLAHGMAHDLGNTVNALALHLQLLEQIVPSETRRRLEPLTHAVGSMRGTLARLDHFSGWRVRPLAAVSLARAVAAAADLVRVQLSGCGRNVRARVAVPARLPSVPGQLEDLTHVFVNLLINARDAMPNGGTVSISARCRGERVVVTIEDEGSGFAPADLPHVFEPLFTTKGAAGHGLGLALAHATITGAGGTIRAGNRRAGGAVITIELPRAAQIGRRR